LSTPFQKNRPTQGLILTKDLFFYQQEKTMATKKSTSLTSSVRGVSGSEKVVSSSSERPRLGTVMRFNPTSGIEGVKLLEKTGLKVASSGDFKSAGGIPNNFGGADVQYFERFNIAIARVNDEEMSLVADKGLQSKVVISSRAERVYKALGSAGSQKDGVNSFQELYLRGYRDGVNHLIDQLLSDGAAYTASSAMKLTDARNTWAVQACKVHKSKRTGRGVRIAILDTGFDHTHPDFAGRIITKKSFVTNSSDSDVQGHGTHCIGISCGPRSPKNVPRYGVAYEAEIYAGKVLGDDGLGTDRSVLAGMTWALENRCEIISMSLGSATSIGDLPNEDYEHVGQVCLDAGSIVIAAAGNESERPGLIAPVGAPANASTILAVAAIDSNFAIAKFSCGKINQGQEVDIAAPGVDILSTLPGGKYEKWSGTSMATPYVAGIAALIAQSNVKYRGSALWIKLLQTVAPLNLPATDGGNGLVQAPL
jgi:subtilisin family serine protease